MSNIAKVIPAVGAVWSCSTPSRSTRWWRTTTVTPDTSPKLTPMRPSTKTRATSRTCTTVAARARAKAWWRRRSAPRRTTRPCRPTPRPPLTWMDCACGVFLFNIFVDGTCSTCATRLERHPRWLCTTSTASTERFTIKWSKCKYDVLILCVSRVRCRFRLARKEQNLATLPTYNPKRRLIVVKRLRVMTMMIGILVCVCRPYTTGNCFRCLRCRIVIESSQNNKAVSTWHHCILDCEEVFSRSWRYEACQIFVM